MKVLIVDFAYLETLFFSKGFELLNESPEDEVFKENLDVADDISKMLKKSEKGEQSESRKAGEFRTLISSEDDSIIVDKVEYVCEYV